MNLPVKRICSDLFWIAMNNLGAITFPDFKTNLSIARSLKIIGEAREAMAKTHNSLLEKYGTKTDIPGEFRISPNRTKEFQEELDKQKVEIDVPAWDIVLPSGALLCGRDLSALEGVVRLEVAEKGQNAPEAK
jgi:hypothetical protein